MTTETGVDEGRAQQLRDRLADQLTATGDGKPPLAGGGTTRTAARVPATVLRLAGRRRRPHRVVAGDRESAGEDAWLNRVYENTTWTAQLDGNDASWEREGPQLGGPTAHRPCPGCW